MNVKEIWLQSLRTERRITRETISHLTDGDVNFRPTPEQMPFGQQALHIISCQKTLLGALQGKGWEWELGYDLEKYPTLEAILNAFDDMHDESVSYYEGLEPEQYERHVETPWSGPEPMLLELMNFLTHEAHHRGQLVVMLRLKGMQPPQF